MRKNSKILVAIIFVGLALAGLISVQVYWVNYTFHLSEKEFTEKVKDALQKTAEEMNDQQIAYEMFTKVHINPNEGFYLLKNKWKNKVFANSADTIPMFYDDSLDADFRWNNLMFSQHVNVSMIFQFRYTSYGKDTSLAYANNFEKATLKTYRETFSEGKPIQERYDPYILDSILKKNLHAFSIFEDFSFGFIDKNNNMLVYTQNTGNAAALLASLFKTSITPRYFSRPFDLSIIFNDYSSLIFATFKKLLGASITIVFILMVSFFIFVRMILRQRRLSELKNDFINNMTHEFKTPLTNISLAVESMTEQKMLKDEKGEKMIKIVGQESERLRENIERILQISRYEKEKPHLTIDKIDVHQLIQKVIAVFDPHFIENEIQFHSRLSATKNYINVDEMHFFNILFNIIDNAIKYNTSKPVISITTQDSQHGIILTIKDNGIGISLNDQKNIFEKFYRVQQGNLHDVKGYGLGLSYVKLIVESHSGQIKVRSQPGQGSEFEIFIPDNS